MKYHLMAFVAGFLLDCILGDPMGWPHPIRWIGSLIAHLSDYFLEKAEKKANSKKLNKENAQNENGYLGRLKRSYGVSLVIIVIAVPALITFFLLF
ncbi:MAG: cobalamin biosynthesis protein, partial [Butyrivibrio sp.]|nr:cobalamin biosynthesis protein [Butyrivibrio sp.]